MNSPRYRLTDSIRALWLDLKMGDLEPSGIRHEIDGIYDDVVIAGKMFDGWDWPRSWEDHLSDDCDVCDEFRGKMTFESTPVLPSVCPATTAHVRVPRMCEHVEGCYHVAIADGLDVDDFAEAAADSALSSVRHLNGALSKLLMAYAITSGRVPAWTSTDEVFLADRRLMLRLRDEMADCLDVARADIDAAVRAEKSYGDAPAYGPVASRVDKLIDGWYWPH